MIPDGFYLNSSPSSQPPPPGSSSSWTWEQDKQFETAIVFVPEGTPDRWEKIASRVPGKTALEVDQHYQVLLDDIGAIEAGLVDLPDYTDDFGDSSSSAAAAKPKGGGESEQRRKGTPWSEDEHRLFLIGLQKFGKGDWRSISRQSVVTRTPTQVASHAQKYFNRINSDKKEKKRSSIHDITVDEATILQANNPSQQQTMDTQVSFTNHGAVSGYQTYGFQM